MEPTLPQGLDADFEFDDLPATVPTSSAGDLVPPQHNNTLKNQDRIGAIRARMWAKKTLTLFTPIACRQLRRDFNIASAKMYVYGLQRSYRMEIIDALARFSFAVDLLVMDTKSWVGHPSPLTAREFDLLLVSPESVKMMRILQSVDRCMIGVYGAYIAGEMTKEERDQLLLPFHMAYLDFKRVAMKLELGQSAQEMVDSMN